MICSLLQILFPVVIRVAEVRTCWIKLYIIILYLAMCTAYVNNFIASVCPLHLLFLFGFEYHLKIMILLSPLFRNLYQIYVFGIGGSVTLTLGVRHFWPEIHLMLDGNKLLSAWQKIVYPHTDFTINSDFLSLFSNMPCSTLSNAFAKSK